MNPIPIIYQNQEIVIINKPQGVAVQGGQNVKNPLDKILPLQLNFPIYLVHRLDQETSGLLIVAKSPIAANKWTNIISQKSVKKEYDAICVGCPIQQNGKFETKIEDHGVFKSALTYYQVVKNWCVDINVDGSPEPFPIIISHIHLTLATGRMHQIRIHLADAGFPIVGDDKYGNFKTNKMLKKAIGIKRLQLVSSKLTIPIDNKNVEFSIKPEFNFDFNSNLSQVSPN